MLPSSDALAALGKREEAPAEYEQARDVPTRWVKAYSDVPE
jgi:hypothetical protein